jgi:G:T-mismatch repair DNA endonuclease (very short patch repair protein)
MQSHRPRCPLALVVDSCSFLVDGHCLHACWSGHACPGCKVPPDKFQFWSEQPPSAEPVRCMT